MWEAHQIPFSLGFEGEYWSKELPGLVIPIPGTDKSVLATRYSVKASGDGYAMVYNGNWHKYDDVLMLACSIKNFMDNYRG